VNLELITRRLFLVGAVRTKGGQPTPKRALRAHPSPPALQREKGLKNLEFQNEQAARSRR